MVVGMSVLACAKDGFANTKHFIFGAGDLQIQIAPC